MSSVKELSQKLDKIKKREENKKCFDCGEKGTTYVCIDFGTFICSRCAGILRELNFKVKGTGVSIFNQKEIDILEKNGNEVANKIWMAKYKEGKDGKPSTKNDDELRDFLKDKYKQKKCRSYLEFPLPCQICLPASGSDRVFVIRKERAAAVFYDQPDGDQILSGL